VRKLKPDARGRSSASSARPASARPRSGARSRAPRAASSCASRSAACATRPRSAATGAPTSARCPAASSRGSTRPARRTRCSCSTRSTRSAPTSAATRPRRCSRCSTRSRTHLPRPLPRRPYDLSRVMFITTANLLDPIQPAFLDRMEVIRLSGYTLEEKLAIARRHLIPKQLEGERAHRRADRLLRRRRCGGSSTSYTREAGLRNLEREIAAICRKVAVRGGQRRAAARVAVGPRKVEELLGPQALRRGAAGPRPGRRGHRPRLDRGRRRPPVHRGGGGAGQGASCCSPASSAR
jgi:hypothetical protein